MLASFLVPFISKRISYEILCLTVLLSFPLVWKGWCIPAVVTVSFLVDKLSAILVVLTLWISILMIMLKPTDSFMNLNILLLLMSLLGFFSVSSLLSLYILFEASLLPTLCLIMGWGYQPERLEASYYFVFYTISLSLPLLASLTWLSSVSGGTYLHFDTLCQKYGSIVSILMLSVFLIKLPLFMTHFWLPKAHVEAPVTGSMILAGVLLKTGGYGVMRVFLYLKASLVSYSFLALSLLGMVYMCIVCLYCIDLKQIIAFSSVSHMNFMITGLLNSAESSHSGSVIMMVSHGLCSSLMFLLADLSYKRFHSRSVLINKGVLSVAPPLSMLWGITVLFNMGVPPSAGSLSELLIVLVCANTLVYATVFGFYLFCSAFYSMYLYSVVNHGNSVTYSFGVDTKEALIMMSHLIPLSCITLVTSLLLT